MLTSTEYLLILAGYFLGCVTAGYYVVRFMHGTDIRHQGSGNVGARNVGRVAGPVAGVATFLVDFGKGALAVWLAGHFESRPLAVIGVILAVAAGHIWPIQLRFHGGKGAATALGALLTYEWPTLIIIAALFITIFIFLRNFTLAGLLGFTFCPLGMMAMNADPMKILGVIALTVLVLWAHRKTIREEIVEMAMRRHSKRMKEETHE